MQVTQSKKTGKFSITQLEDSDLTKFHNILTDMAMKYQIRLALLELYNKDKEEADKLSDPEEIKEYWEQKGLVLE
jgi:hypothetical protein